VKEISKDYDVSVRSSSIEDLNKLSQCYINSFPDSLSSKLGSSYVKKMLSWYIENNNAFIFHIEDNGCCKGFIGGSIENVNLYGSSSSMAQHAFYSGILSLLIRPHLFFSKKIRLKYNFLWKNILYKTKRKSPTRKSNNKPVSLGLIVICVDPDWQGKGIGKVLLDEFDRKGYELDINRLHLSVSSSNSVAISFYKKNGWVVKDELQGQINMFRTLD